MDGTGSTEYRVLGPIAAIRDGQTLPLGGPRQEAVLALLLLQPGRAVPTDELAEELWHGAPPAGAATTVRVYVSRLRNVLPDAPISRRSGGYTLDVPPDCVDAHRFEHLLTEAGEALRRGEPRRPERRIDEALALWHGRPFGALADEGRLALEAKRLEELRVLAHEERVEARLQLGHDAALVEELEALVAEHPYRERLWRQLMLALYRAGRQADALATYRRARTLLDDELGVEPGPELRALEQAVLRHDVPRVEAPEERHNLPAPLTSFVGRARELAELRDLLERSRLVTLTGIGGVGKTRLALEVARELVPELSDGVYFVDLGLVADPALVPTQVARSLELQEHAGTPLIDLMLHRLRESQLLLVLDNCEHVTRSCAQLAAALLESCPRLHVLMTSREPLGIFGEFEFPVLPLGVPSGDDPDEARSSEAVRLFLERARAIRQRPDDDAAVATAGRICRDLEGLPLAIELAAARTKALSLDEISERLSDRFRFLVSWRRLATARHRTLREAIDWSYELLSPGERSLLRQVSVFGGGFRLAAAADICVGGDEERALTLVERLVDASLLNPDEVDAATRYRLLETVREYAAGRLREAGEERAVKSAHARYYLELAEQQGPTSSASLSARVRRIAPEDGNLITALRWFSESADIESQLRLVAAIWRYWWVRGELAHGRRWLDEVIQHEDVDPTARARALEGAAGLAWAAGDSDRASEHAEAARALLSAGGDELVQLGCATLLGHLAIGSGDLERAEELFLECFLLADAVDRARGVHASTALAHLNLAAVRSLSGELDRAATGYAAATDHYAQDDDRYGVALSTLYAAIVEIHRDRHDAAAEMLVRSLEVFDEMGFPQYSSQCLDAIANVVWTRGRAEDAVTLAGAANALRARFAGAEIGIAHDLAERVIALTRAELGEGAFESSWSEGCQLTAEAASVRARSALELSLL